MNTPGEVHSFMKEDKKKHPKKKSLPPHFSASLDVSTAHIRGIIVYLTYEEYVLLNGSLVSGNNAEWSTVTAEVSMAYFPCLNWSIYCHMTVSSHRKNACDLLAYIMHLSSLYWDILLILPILFGNLGLQLCVASQLLFNQNTFINSYSTHNT